MGQYLRGNGRELERLQCLVIGGGTGVDVDHHDGATQAREEVLQHACQLAVPERDHLRGSRPEEEKRNFDLLL